MTERYPLLFVAVPLFPLAAIASVVLFLVAEKRPDLFTRPLDIAGYISVPVVLTALLMAALAGTGHATGIAWLMVVVLSHARADGANHGGGLHAGRAPGDPQI